LRDSSALTIERHTDYAVGESRTPYSSVTTYNRFYEFGTDKSDLADIARILKPRPWAGLDRVFDCWNGLRKRRGDR